MIWRATSEIAWPARARQPLPVAVAEERADDGAVVVLDRPAPLSRAHQLDAAEVQQRSHVVAHVRQPLLDLLGDLVRAGDPLVEDRRGSARASGERAPWQSAGRRGRAFVRAMTADLNRNRAAQRYDAFAPLLRRVHGADRTTRRGPREVLGARGAPRARRGTALLDLACGTGKSFLPFLRRGFDVTGCDSSPRDARRGGAQGARGDARARRPPRRCRCSAASTSSPASTTRSTTCSTTRDLAAAFGSASPRTSRRGGLALFDLNTLRAYRTTFARDSVSERDGDRVRLARRVASPSAAPGLPRRAPRSTSSRRARDGALRARRPRATSSATSRASRWSSCSASAGLECVAVHGVLDDGALVERAGRDAPPQGPLHRETRERR